MTKRLALLLTALTALTVLTGCDAAYKKLGPEYGALPPCGVQIHVVSPAGDFNEAQKLDIQYALAEIGLWSNRDVVYAGEVAYRSNTPNRPGHTVVAERTPPGAPYQGYALPNKFIQIGPWYMTLASPTPNNEYGYTTFRGVFLHEAMHAIVGAEDMYNDGDGHPELIMGKGMLRRNTMNLGDVKAAVAGGCPR